MAAKLSRVLLAAFVATALTSGVAAGETVEAAKRRDIEELLRIFGQWDAGKGVGAQLLPAFRQVYTSVPDQVWRDLAEDLEATTLNDRYVAHYDRLYTAAEIREILDFQRTPLGRKLLANAPVTMTEMLVSKEEFRLDVARRIEWRLGAAGYTPRESPAPAAPSPGTVTLDRPGFSPSASQRPRR